MRLFISVIAIAAAMCSTVGLAAEQGKAALIVPPVPVLSKPANTNCKMPSAFTDADKSELTKQEIVGTWSQYPSCNQKTTFNADGTYSDYLGNNGRWSLEHGYLSQAPNGGAKFKEHVNPLNPNVFAYGKPGGAVLMFVRIP